jgi:hypothetical protein
LDSFYEIINKKNFKKCFFLFDNIFDTKFIKSIFSSIALDFLVINDSERGIFLIRRNFIKIQKKIYKKKINLDFFFSSKTDIKHKILRECVFLKNFSNNIKQKNKEKVFNVEYINKFNYEKKKIVRIFNFLYLIEEFIFFFKTKLKENNNSNWNIEEFINKFLKICLPFDLSLNLLKIFNSCLENIFFFLSLSNLRKINGLLKLMEFLRLIGIFSESKNKNVKIFFSSENEKFQLLYEPSINLIFLETSFLFKQFFENFNSIMFCLPSKLNLNFCFFFLIVDLKFMGI